MLTWSALQGLKEVILSPDTTQYILQQLIICKFQEREQYVEDMKGKLAEIKGCKTDDIVVTADEMSVFYKTFLDKHWYVHLNYNIEWYKKNGRLMLLAIQTNLYKVYKNFL